MMILISHRLGKAQESTWSSLMLSKGGMPGPEPELVDIERHLID